MKAKKKKKQGAIPSTIPFTRAHSKPHRLEEQSRASRKREERDVKRGEFE